MNSRRAPEILVKELQCRCVSVYEGALTRGKRYRVLDWDDVKRQVRMKGDNGRSRWFPIGCFDQSTEPLPALVDYEVDDDIVMTEKFPIEVTILLSNGQRRFCFIATPAALVACGNWIPGTKVRFHYGNRHVLIAERFDEDLLERMLRYLESQDELEACTMPLAAIANTIAD